MVKKWLPIGFLVALIAVIIWSEQVTAHSYIVIATFCLRMLPNLAPCLLLDYLFINSNGLYYLDDFFRKRKSTSKKRIYPFFIIILGLLSGTPTLATYVNDSLDKKLISDKDGQSILNSFAFPSLPFLLSVLFVPFSNQYRIFLLILLFGTSFVNYQIMTRHEKPIYLAPELKVHGNIITESIFDTAKTLLLMLGTMLLFTLPMIIFQVIFPTEISFILSGLLEFSTSLYQLNAQTDIILKTAFIFLLTFSSVSVFAQIKIMCPHISIKKVVLNRLMLAAINSFIGFIIFYFAIL